jgi:hypothetical protein
MMCRLIIFQSTPIERDKDPANTGHSSVLP